MTFQPDQDDFGAVCPYLGLADDADSHATYATEAHRCYRLPNPTRIATGHQENYCLGANHVTCPVYLGEGVPGAAAAGAGAAARASAPTMARAPSPVQTVRGPQARDNGGARRPAAPQRDGRPAPQRPRRPNPGTIGPRPRSGGISMPVATIGLFVLAIVVIVLAFAIDQLVGGGDGGQLSPAETVGTQTAQQTANAAGQQTQPAGQTSPAANQTAGASPSAASKTPGASSSAAAGGAKTWVVKSGDYCSTIAEASNITLQQLLDANKMTEADCNDLKVDQVLRLP